jgi:hypothetical protein
MSVDGFGCAALETDSLDHVHENVVTQLGLKRIFVLA